MSEKKRYIKFKLSFSERLMAFLFGVIPEYSLKSAEDKHIIVIDKQQAGYQGQQFQVMTRNKGDILDNPISHNDIPFFDMGGDENNVKTNMAKVLNEKKENA